MQKKTKRVSIRPKRSDASEGVTALGKLIRDIGSLGGSALGGMVGMSGAGSMVGNGLGATVSRWLGQGDYTLTSNSLVNRVRASGDIPNMHKNGQSVIIRHREYIGDILSSTNFVTAQAIPLNPGLVGSFPWLAGIAQQYQEYTWRGLIFEFISTSGDVVASANTALGSVCLATQYRSTAGQYYSKEQMLNEYFSTDGKPSECFCHPIECDPKENPYNVQYVRSGSVPTGEDPKSYDIGVTYVATTGMQAANVNVGELWATYEVELRKPIASALLGYGVLSADIGSASAPSATNWFNGTPTFYQNSLGLTLTTATVTFPAGSNGTFLLQWFGRGTGVTVTTPFSAIVNNLTYGTLNTANTVNTTWGSTSDGVTVTTYITVTNPQLPAIFQPSFAGLSGPATWYLRVVQVPPNPAGYY